MREALNILIGTGILCYFLAMNVIQFVIMVRAFFYQRRYLDEAEADRLEDLLGTAYYLPITLICPVYNEEAGVVPAVRTLLNLRYPEHQVLVVNDGSKDGTLARLIEAYDLQPCQRVVRMAIPTEQVRGVYESQMVSNLVVVDKENGGKSDALNCGLNLAKHTLVCCMDGDCLLEHDALLRIVRPFLDVPHTVACGGVIRPLNGCRVTPAGIRGMDLPRKWLARFQVVEYLRAFLYGRVGLAAFGSLFVLSGAFGLFRRDLLLEAGGFSRKTIGEDFEAVVRLHRRLREAKRPYHIAMVPDPICWTEVPESWKILARQRNRWHRGLLETLWRHKGMFLNPRYGFVGLFSLPYFLLFEALAPVVETVGYVFFLWLLCTQALNTQFAVLFFLLAFFLGILNSLVSVLLEVHATRRYQGMRSLLGLMLVSVLENFGYRQVTVWWRLRGLVDFLRGKQQWGQMDRKGIHELPKQPT